MATYEELKELAATLAEQKGWAKTPDEFAGLAAIIFNGQALTDQTFQLTLTLLGSLKLPSGAQSKPPLMAIYKDNEFEELVSPPEGLPGETDPDQMKDKLNVISNDPDKRTVVTEGVDKERFIDEFDFKPESVIDGTQPVVLDDRTELPDVVLFAIHATETIGLTGLDKEKVEEYVTKLQSYTSEHGYNPRVTAFTEAYKTQPAASEQGDAEQVPQLVV